MLTSEKMTAMADELAKLALPTTLLEDAAKARGVGIPAINSVKNLSLDPARRREIAKNIVGTLRGIPKLSSQKYAGMIRKLLGLAPDIERGAFAAAAKNSAGLSANKALSRNMGGAAVDPFVAARGKIPSPSGGSTQGFEHMLQGGPGMTPKFAFELSRFSGPLNPMPSLRYASGQPDPGQAMASTDRATQALIKKEGSAGVLLNLLGMSKGATVPSPATQLSKTTHVGLPKVTTPAGPSLRDQIKPTGPRTGIGIPGADRGGL